MRIHLFPAALLVLAATWASPGFAASGDGALDTITGSRDFVPVIAAFPFTASEAPKTIIDASALKTAMAFPKPSTGDQTRSGIWPFGKKDESSGDEAFKPKSTRKAFFLSLILPGLGEFYVGSKRGIAFLGVEAVSWWMYVNYTKKGKDFENEFEAFADDHWRYSAPSGEYSYVEWLADKLRGNNISDADLPRNYADLASRESYMDSITQQLIDRNVQGISHAIPSTKTQQYYEMVGKYPQFVYGWEDITGYAESTDSNGNTIKVYYNPTLVDASGNPKGNYGEGIRNVKSPLRDEYENIRYDSNKNLKRGLYGVNLMILNRIVSAVDAGRLAYHHNKGLESELSMVRMNIVSKQVNDHTVPMLVFSKRF